MAHKRAVAVQWGETSLCYSSRLELVTLCMNFKGVIWDLRRKKKKWLGLPYSLKNPPKNSNCTKPWRRSRWPCDDAASHRPQRSHALLTGRACWGLWLAAVLFEPWTWHKRWGGWVGNPKVATALEADPFKKKYIYIYNIKIWQPPRGPSNQMND